MDANLNLSIIAAVSEYGVIGVGGGLPPWDLKTDLKRFAELTKGHTVIVGRKTHESILLRLGHHLKGRRTLVITGQKDYKGLSSAVEVVHSWKETISLIESIQDEVFVIGGAEIYKLALPFANTIYLTRVRASFEGDTLFPTINPNEWHEVYNESHQADENNTHPFCFVTLERKVKPRFVNLDHARVDEQSRVMEEILNQGVCPFCVEHLWKFHKKPILRQTRYWILTENQWPYENTRVHFLAIYTTHVESLGEMEPEAGRELTELARWVEREYKLPSGALVLGVRFGNLETSGATVRHLHAQLLSAAVTDRTDPRYKPVRFRVG